MEGKLPALYMDKEDIEVVKHNIQLLEENLPSFLKEGEDYTRSLFPGQKKAVLLDPGAAILMNFFNLYPQRKILLHTEEERGEEPYIRFIIETTLVRRKDQLPVASGVGSASSREIKYAYRWVPDPENYGYSNEEKEKLKTRLERKFDVERKKWTDVILYRIPNPDIGDLHNTLLKMAAKRSEVDAVLGLPGVSRLFTQDLRPPQAKIGEKKESTSPLVPQLVAEPEVKEAEKIEEKKEVKLEEEVQALPGMEEKKDWRELGFVTPKERYEMRKTLKDLLFLEVFKDLPESEKQVKAIEWVKEKLQIICNRDKVPLIKDTSQTTKKQLQELIDLALGES